MKSIFFNLSESNWGLKERFFLKKHNKRSYSWVLKNHKAWKTYKHKGSWTRSKEQKE